MPSHSPGAPDEASRASTGNIDHAPGRRPSTSRQRIFTSAMELFAARGYSSTNVEDIAVAAGISRRTLFRYYPNKAAIPWGEFSDQIAVMREHFVLIDDALPLRDALSDALVFFNTFPASETRVHRARMRLLLDEPELQAHSVLMYSDWRAAIAEFVAGRRGESTTDLIPLAVAHAAQGIAMSSYQAWLSLPEDEGSQEALHGYLQKACEILD